ncbi:MAG: DUF2336 domain-containing protein [Hyphomicrobiales bacterium]|nr:DUF2336 domain-containing protein [Hyphomicrobiales bacterium]
MLSQSNQLDEPALIQNARTKGQGHLLAISTRPRLSGSVTEILVERGNDIVVISTVNNEGLIGRAGSRDDIATCVARRPAMPRHHLLKLINQASASVRARMAAANPALADEISSALQTATRQARSAPSAMSEDAAISHELVRLLAKDGRLNENEVLKFAANEKFDETNAAIACLARIPVAVVEAMMIEASNEGILILSKVANFSWPTVKAIIDMRHKLANQPLGETVALRFHRMQQATSDTSVA